MLLMLILKIDFTSIENSRKCTIQFIYIPITRWSHTPESFAVCILNHSTGIESYRYIAELYGEAYS